MPASRVFGCRCAGLGHATLEPLGGHRVRRRGRSADRRRVGVRATRRRGLERAGEGLDGGEAIGAVSRQRPSQHLVDLGRDARRARPAGRGNRRDHLVQRGVHVGAGEGEAGGPGEPAEARQRPLIAAVIDGVLAPLGLLGRHELGRAEHGPRNGQLGGRRLQHLRQTEVDDLREHAAVGGVHQEHVVRLEIAVDDAGGVRLGQRRRHLVDDLHHRLRRQRPHALEARLQVLAFEEFHHDVRLPCRRGTEAEDVDDVRVIELAGHLRLAPEPRRQLRIGQELAVHDLHRHALAGPGVVALVDGPHGPLSEQPRQTVCAVEDGTGGEDIGALGFGHQARLEDCRETVSPRRPKGRSDKSSRRMLTPPHPGGPPMDSNSKNPKLLTRKEFFVLTVTLVGTAALESSCATNGDGGGSGGSNGSGGNNGSGGDNGSGGTGGSGTGGTTGSGGSGSGGSGSGGTTASGGTTGSGGATGSGGGHDRLGRSVRRGRRLRFRRRGPGGSERQRGTRRKRGRGSGRYRWRRQSGGIGHWRRRRRRRTRRWRRGWRWWRKRQRVLHDPAPRNADRRRRDGHERAHAHGDGQRCDSQRDDPADLDHQQRRARRGAHAHDHADRGPARHAERRWVGDGSFDERQRAYPHVSNQLHHGLGRLATRGWPTASPPRGRLRHPALSRFTEPGFTLRRSRYFLSATHEHALR